MGRESGTPAAPQPDASPAGGSKSLPLAIGILLLIALLLQLQSWAISLPAPKPKGAGAGENAAAAAGGPAGDITAPFASPDLKGALTQLDARAIIRQQDLRRTSRAAQTVGHMDFKAAALLLSQWPPPQAAALLDRMPPRLSGPILDEADAARAAEWLTLLTTPEALPPLDEKYRRIAAEAGWQAAYPQEDLGSAAGAAAADAAASNSDTTLGAPPGADSGAAAQGSAGSTTPQATT